MAGGKDLGALIGQIGADISAWEKAMDKIEADFKEMEKQGDKATKSIGEDFERVGKKMQQMGKQMTMRVTLPILGVAAASVKAFGDFDAAMTQSLAIMGNVSSAMENEMSLAAREVAKTTTLSAKQAAESYFFLASAGLDAEQSLAALPQVAAFAQAGMFDMATATDLATDAQSALGLTVDNAAENLANMTRVTDVLVKANTLANATVEQFSTALTREAGAALKSFGKDIEEGVAVLAAFADQGIKGERAGSGLSRVIRLMTQAANQNSEAMARLGIEVFDSEGKMNNLADIIADLEVAFAGMSDQQRTASLEAIGFTARVQQMILPLIGSSNAIREYESELRNAGGTTEEVAGKQLDAFNEQVSLLWDNIKDIGIIIGQDLEGAMRSMVSMLSDAAEWFQEMGSTGRIALLSLASVLAVSGPLLTGLGFMVQNIGHLIVNAPKAWAAMKKLTAAMIANPYVAVGTAIAVIAARAWFANQRLQELHETIQDALNADFQGQTLDELNKLITRVEGRMEAFRENVAGLDPESFEQYQKWQAILEDLISKRDRLAASESAAVMATKTLEDALALSDTIQMIQAAYRNMNEAAKETDIGLPIREAKRAADNILPAFEQAQNHMKELTEEDLFDVEMDLGDKMFPPGSLGALQERLTMLRQRLQYATDPEVVARLNGQIANTRAQMDALNGNMEKSGQLMQGVFQTLDNIFQQAVLHGEKLGNILGKIAKQLASKALINGLAMLVSGGSFGLGKLLFGSVGNILGVGDALIRDDGSVIQFHPNDDILAMKDFGNLQASPAMMNKGMQPASIEEAIRRGMERAVVIARMDAGQARKELDKYDSYQSRLGN